MVDTRLGASLLLALAMTASSCSLLSQESETTTDAGGDGELTSGTVDNDTGVSGDAGGAEPTASTSEPGSGSDAGSGVDKGTVTQEMEALPAENSGEALKVLVEEVHGPTDDVSGSMNRLVSFPPLPTPAGAHIIDLRANPRIPFDGGDTFSLQVNTRFVADGPSGDLISFYETSLAAEGWSLVGTKEDSRADSAPYTQLDFEKESRERLIITVVEDTKLPKTLVEAAYNHPASEDLPLTTRFQGWHGDLPIPAGGTFGGTTISTNHGPGRTSYSVSSDYSYAEDLTDEMLETQIVATADEGGYPHKVSDYGGIEMISEQYEDLRIRSFTAGRVNVEGKQKFLTPGFDGVEIVAGEQSTEPLPDFASREQIENVVNEMHGPTTDVAGQMQRLGNFPDMPTPNGADVIQVSSRVGHIIGSDDQKAILGTVEMWVDGDIEVVVEYYETTFAGLGWSPVGSNNETEDSGQTKITKLDYDIPGVDAGVSNAFELTVTDDVDDARTKVKLNYTEFVATESSNMERWLGWQGEAPIPAGETIEGAGVSTNGLFGQAIFFFTDYSYDGKTEAALSGEVDGLIGSSEYALDPEDDSELRVELTHPDFSAASVRYLEFSDRTRLTLEASRPLAAN